MKNRCLFNGFCCFRLLLEIAKSPPKMHPKVSQKFAKSLQNPAKIHPRRPKMAPRRPQDGL